MSARLRPPPALRVGPFLARAAISAAWMSGGAALGRHPVVVFSVERSGSVSLFDALRTRLGRRVVKAHALRRSRLRLAEEPTPGQPPWESAARQAGAWAIHWAIIRPRRPATFVIPIREPLSRAASYIAVVPPEQGARELAQQVNYAAAWLEVEAAGALGLDPYSIPFDAQAGCGAGEVGPWRVLLVRTDVADGSKAQWLAGQLGLRTLPIVRQNGSPAAGIAAAVAAIRAAPALVEAALDSRFVRHFWTQGDQARLRERWLSPAPTAGTA